MKILIVLNNLRVANGVATVIMNQYDTLIEHKIDVDFIQFLDFDSPYIEHIKNNDGKIFLVKKNKNSIKQMKRILKDNQYDIVHINQMNAQTVELAIMAHHYGIKNVIFHSHNTKIPGGIKRRILEKGCNITYKIFADSLVACSEQAGKDSFGKKNFKILRNAIDVQKFQFDRNERNKIRKELDVSDDIFVLGTVCRYASQKNPCFMIDIVNELIKSGMNIKFLWVGSAPKKDDPILIKMKEKVKEYGIENEMLWVGSKSDVYKWYSAMDAFVMPSLWEGLGITYIEAQANSLPTFASDVVPKETQVTDLIQYYSLDLGAKEWAQEIKKCEIRNEKNIIDYTPEIRKAGYDLFTAKADLYQIYKTIVDIGKK